MGERERYVHIAQNQPEFPSNFGICKCKSRFALLSLKEMQDVALNFKHCRLVFSSSILCCFLLPTNLVVILYSFLNRGPTTANQVLHILLLLLLFQNSFIYTGCLYRHNSHCCLSHRKKLILFHPWHELTKVTGLRSQLSYAWESAMKFQNHKPSKEEVVKQYRTMFLKLFKISIFIFYFVGKLKFQDYFLLLIVITQVTTEFSSQEGTQPTYTSYNDCKSSREKNWRYSSSLSHPSIQQNIEKYFKIHHTPSELHRGTGNFKLRWG